MIALHHWSKEVLEYSIQHHNRRDLLKPVNRDVAQALGIIDKDPRNRFTPCVVRDGNGRTRPDRTKGFPSQEQWMMVPNHSLENVQKIMTSFLTRKSESARRRFERQPPHQQSQAHPPAAAAVAANNRKDARIAELERELADNKRELAERKREQAEREREFAHKEEMHEEDLAAARYQFKKFMAKL